LVNLNIYDRDDLQMNVYNAIMMRVLIQLII
ncbi:hypothetical protein Q127_02717, partial [Staphylococcus aureus M1117]